MDETESKEWNTFVFATQKFQLCKYHSINKDEVETNGTDMAVQLQARTVSIRLKNNRGPFWSINHGPVLAKARNRVRDEVLSEVFMKFKVFLVYDAVSTANFSPVGTVL